MTEYVFEQMTPDEALFISAADLIDVGTGTAKGTTVVYNDNGTYAVTIGAKTLTFGAEFAALARSQPATHLFFPDKSFLYVGDAADNNADLPPIQSGGSSGGDGAAYGGQGNDRLLVRSGSWLLQGNQGDDRLLTDGNNVVNATIYGGQGNDTIGITATKGANFAQGNKGDDSIIGISTSDTLLGGQGNDTIEGSFSPDFINGNLGNDSLSGSGTLLGEGGNDTMVSGREVGSVLRGGDGDDVLRMGVFGNQSGPAASMFGDDGADTISSSSIGSDDLRGGAGDDLIQSSNNGSSVVGDVLDGGDGNDSLDAQFGNDTLSGGAGADTLSSGPGVDVLSGGAGSDLFLLQFYTSATQIGERITDWSSEDRIRLEGSVTGGYAEGTAADRAGLEMVGNTLAASLSGAGTGAQGALAVQVGDDVYVLSARNGLGINVAAVLVGRTLMDISADNFT